VYAAALETAYEGSAEDVITPASLFLDAPEVFNYGRGQTYSPDNFGKTYSNQQVTLREALVHSLNVVTVRIAERVGYSTVSRMAEKVGLRRPQVLPAVALGTSEATPLEIAQSYSAFANGGQRVNARGLVKLVDSTGRAAVEEKPKTRQVLRPQIAWLMTNIMQDVLNRGTGARARAMGFSGTAAGKTGTSRDGWFAGYTPNLVCVVWVGFDDNSELGLEGSKSALPIWAAFMKQALALRPDLGGEAFAKPDSILDAEIDPTTGLLSTDQCPIHKSEFFIEGTQPEEKCEGHSGDLELPIPFEWPEGNDEVTERPRRVVPPAAEKDPPELRKPEKPRAP
jgi:penicillin-binding protein 1B